MEAARLTWRPLGAIFVERGLITKAELEEALAEQEKSGKRLGEIIVRKGLVSGAELTAALADQLGVEVMREESFGSGLWGEIRRRHPRAKDDEQPEEAESEGPDTVVPFPAFEEAEPPQEAPLPAHLQGELDQPHAELAEEIGAHPAAAPPPHVPPSASHEEIEHLQAQVLVLQEAFDQQAATADAAVARAAELEDRLAALEAEKAAAEQEASAVQGGLRAEVEEREARIQALTNVRDALRFEAKALESARSELESTRSELESARSELESVRSELESARSELESAGSDRETLEQQLGQQAAAREMAARRAQELEGEVSTLQACLLELTQGSAASEDRVEAERSAHAEATSALERVQQERTEHLARVEQLESEREELSLQLEHAAVRAAELDRVCCELEERESRLEGLTEERDELWASVGTLTAELASAREAAAALGEQSRTLEGLSNRLLEAEAIAVSEAAGHAETRRVLAQALADLVGGSPTAASALAVSLVAGPSEFLLFAPVGSRYQLVERSGSPPTPGEKLALDELDGASFVVAKVGRSPLPLDTRPCVYLESVV